MSEARKCELCGAELSATDIGQLCPKCRQSRTIPADSPEPVRLPDLSPAPSDPASPGGSGSFSTRHGPRVRYFGDYELLEEIASGGMGVVYKARQVSLNRLVALKMIRSGQFATEAEVKRFRLEAEAAANLDHPNIVSIYEVGEHEGYHFFSMRLVAGQSLAQRIAECRARNPDPRTALPRDEICHPETAARLLIKVARAVHYAHQRGILHRDLKPGNILIDEHGEPHVTDFGLAKLVHQDSSLTQAEAVIGTPNYMAPEQAAGKSKQVATAVDIYALGVILYELLAGTTPFLADSPVETIRRLAQEQPKRLRHHNPRVSLDVETICFKCLEKEAAARYGSAEALANDLLRWLKNEPIAARPSSALERCVKWARRKPAIAALTALAVLLAVIGVSAVIWQWQRAALAQKLALLKSEAAETASADAEALRQSAERAYCNSLWAKAEEHFQAGDCSLGMAYLAHILRRDSSHDAVAQRLLSALTYRNFLLPRGADSTKSRKKMDVGPYIEFTHMSPGWHGWIAIEGTPSGHKVNGLGYNISTGIP